MKYIVFLGVLLVATILTEAQTPPTDTTVLVKDANLQVVEAACGQCRLGLPGKDCNLAVRVDGKAYFVDGTSIDEHGDAHAPDGFCQAIRKAEVKGMVVNDRFKVSYFKLLPASPKKPGGPQ